MSVLEALRSWRNAKAQPTAGVRRGESRSAVRPVLTTGACMAAMLLLVVPLITFEADARGGGGGGHGGGGHGGGGQRLHTASQASARSGISSGRLLAISPRTGSGQ